MLFLFFLQTLSHGYWNNCIHKCSMVAGECKDLLWSVISVIITAFRASVGHLQ